MAKQLSADRINRIERHLDAIEQQLKEMRHSLKVYKSDPNKYFPQINNLTSAAESTINSAERVLVVILDTF